MKSIKSNAVISIIKELITTVFPIIVFAYVSRIFSTDGIGIINFSNTFVTYFILIAGLGINRYGTREGAKRRNDKREFSQLFVELTLINLAMTLFSIIVFVVISRNRSFENYITVLMIYGFAIPLSALSMEWVYQAVEDYAYITKRVCIFRIIGLISTFLFVRSKNDLHIFALIQVIANYGNYLLNLFHIRKYIDLSQIQKIHIKKHLGSMLTLFSATLSATLYSNIDITMLGIMTNELEVGVYSVAIKITHMLSAILLAAILCFLPRISNLIAERKEELATEYQKKICNYIYLFTVPCICALVIWGRIVINFFAGQDFAKAYPILCILSITLFTVVTKNLYENCILLPKRKDKIILFSTALGAIVNIFFNSILIPHIKGIGAAAVSVTSESIVVLSYSIYCRRKEIRKNVIQYIKPYLLGGILIIFPWIFIKKILQSYLYGAIVATIVGGSLYIGILFITKNMYLLQLFQELKTNKMIIYLKAVINKVEHLPQKLLEIYREVKVVKGMFDQICKKNYLFGHWKLCWYDKPIIYRLDSKEAQQYIKICFQQSKEFTWKAQLIQVCRNILCYIWKFHDMPGQRCNSIDCVMISRNGKICLFDLSNKLIEKEFSNQKILQSYQVLKNAGYWECFLSPVKKINENIIYEKYVEYVPQGAWTNDILLNVFKRLIIQYSNYLKKVDMKYLEMKKYLNMLPYGDELLECLPDNCIKWIDERCPLIGVCVQHGDMGRGNVLLDKRNEIWVIDFEYAAEYPFFYDLFLFMKLEWERSRSQVLWKAASNEHTELGLLFKEAINCTDYIFSVEEEKYLLLITNLIKTSFDLKNDEDIWDQKGKESQKKKKENYLKFIEMFC